MKEDTYILSRVPKKEWIEWNGSWEIDRNIDFKCEVKATGQGRDDLEKHGTWKHTSKGNLSTGSSDFKYALL